MATKRSAEEMSQQPAEDQDPDYEMVTTMTSSKRMRLLEQDAKDVTVKRIDAIIRKQFDIEMRHKEKEIILIDERIHQARAILDKLRGCIVASYYGNVSSYPAVARGEQAKQSRLDLNHPAIQRVIKQTQTAVPAVSSSSDAVSSVPEDTSVAAAAVEAVLGNGDTEDGALSRPETPVTPMLNGEISELLSGCSTPDSEKLSLSDSQDMFSTVLPGPKGPRNTGLNSFGVGPALPTLKPAISQALSEDGSRFHVKKRIIVGNVSKYIPPENREDSDPSTHKWMVYVRGPHDEPRIDHFVKKIWIFLHPSYRPNDLVEVKEPPFHLTRRGWGEFPIRVQLHFVDPRNKKVDIIHHLKLDRTYTGLQTLGAETIVDVELDRYLFDEAGQPVSRPSTPTVTSIKYKEGCKPEPSSPGASVVMPTTPSPALPPDFRSLTPSTPMEASPAASPSLSGSRKGTPTPDMMLPPSTKNQTGSITFGTMSVKEQGHAISGVIGAGGIVTRTLVKPLSAAASSGQLAIQQQQGGRFVRVMPPLGPITSQAKTAAMLLSTTVAKSPLSVVTQTSDAIVASSRWAVTEGDKTSPVVSPNLGNSPPVTTASPTTKAVNVAEAAASTSPGKGAALAVRIQEGKLVADVFPTVPPAAGSVKPSPVAVAAGGLPSTIATLPTIAQIATAPAAGQIQGVPNVSPPLAQGVASTLQMTGAVNSPGGKLPVAIPPKPGSAGGIKVIPTRTAALGSPTQGASTSLPIIPNPPPGTQYYITAKSTDPNLQGKVILIPQQVFAQASGQSVLVGSKGGRPGASQIQGKGGAALKPTPATKSSFLSPSNVLILPQGSIVPPLPPGSIVQIQQVPSPSRSAPPQPTQTKPRLAVAQKSASAPALVGAKTQAPRIAGMPSGGIIQIQRTTGPSVTKVFPSQLGGGAAAAASPSGISILPEKGTLAKTPSGGVVFVQRSPSTGKLNAQPVTGISVAGQSGIPQKVALAAQLAGAGTLKPGSTVSIIQGQGKPPTIGQTVVLQSPTGLPKLQQVKTIQQSIPRPSHPIILGQSSGVRQGQLPGQTQAILSSDKGKVQLVSVKQEKLPEKLVTPALPLPVGQTPMPLSHEVTISTTDSPSSTPEEELPDLSSQDDKTEAMEVDISTSDLPKTSESDNQKLILKQEHGVTVESVTSSEQAGSPALKQTESQLSVVTPAVKPTESQSSAVTPAVKQTESQLSAVPQVVASTTVVPQPTAVVTSHGLVQVQTPTLSSITTTTQSQTAITERSSIITSPSSTTTSPSSGTTTMLRVDKIQIKQEIVSPPRATTSNIVLAPIPTASNASLVSITPCPILTSQAPTLLTTNTSTTILGPRLAATSTTILRPLMSSTFLGASGTLVRPAGSMLLSRSISTPLLGSSTGAMVRPSTILSSSIPSTILGPSTIGQQTIIVTSAVPQQVISLRNDVPVNIKESDDPLLIELKRRSREGPVSVHGIETMEQLIKIAVEKTPLVLSTRVQSDHPYMATSMEHYYSWSIGKRRAAEWHRALAVKGIVKDAAQRVKKLDDAALWSTKKIMWWCRRHGYTPADPGNTGSTATRQWCNVCGEVEMPPRQTEGNEENIRHDCTAKWMSTSGLLQNTSYTTSDDFVKILQDKQGELGRDDDDSDIEIDVISINTEPRKVHIKKEVVEDSTRIKCFLPPSEGARLVTDTAHEIGVQFKPVAVAEDTYASISQEMVVAATKHFMSELVRGAFANAYGNRKDHRFPEELLPTHIFQKIKEEKTFDFLTNKYLGIPMPEREDPD